MRLKRVISAALAVSMAVSMVPATAVTAFADEAGSGSAVTAAAEGEESADAAVETSGTCGRTEADTLAWSFDEDTGVLTISGAGDMRDYTSDDPAPWKVFGDKITEIKIGDQVTGISSAVFSGLKKLTKVNIPASITRLGSYIFNGDEELVTVDWADGFVAPTVQDTDELLYSKLTYEGTYVPTGMFDHCYKLGEGQELSTWLNGRFTGICCAAFRGTKFTVDFDKLSNMAYWGPYAFANMKNLDSVTLTDSSPEMGRLNGLARTFADSGLKKMVVHAKVVPAWIAENCTELTTVELGSEVTTVETYAFCNTGLTELDVPATAEGITIATAAFINSKNLKSVTLHGNVMLNGAAFTGCGIEDFTIAEGAKVVCPTSPFSEWANSKETIATAVTSVKNVAIMGTLEATEVENATHEQQTTWLWNQMFNNNTGIEETTVNGANLQYIQGSTFPSLKKLNVIGGDATTGYKYINTNNQLENVAIDVDSFTSHNGAFREMKNLKTLSIKAKTAKLGGLDFTLCPELKVIDLSQCGTVQYNCQNANQYCFGNSVEGLPSDVRIYVNNEDANPRTHEYGIQGNYGIVFVVNGGTVDTSDAGFSGVTKAGYTAEWYNGDNALTDEQIADGPVEGNTYTVEWLENAEVDADTDQKDNSQKTQVGDPVKVTITLNTGAYTQAIMTGDVALTFTDENGQDAKDAIDKVLLNGVELEEKEYTGSVRALLEKYFPVATQGLTFNVPLTVTFNKEGNYKANIRITNEAEKLDISSSADIKVNPKSIPSTPLTPAAKLYDLTIKGADVTIKNGDEELKAEKNDKGELIAKVPENADVTVTYTSQSDAVAFEQWTVTTDKELDVDVKTNPLTFKMPAGGVTVEAMTKDASIEEEPNVLGTAAVIGTAAVGTAVLAWQGYELGTELYLKYALPAGAAIPTNRAELAELVWNNAGKPEPVAVLPADAAETEKAIAWAVENDLLKATKDNGEAYEETDSVSKLEVIQCWNKAVSNQ